MNLLWTYTTPADLTSGWHFPELRRMASCWWKVGSYSCGPSSTPRWGRSVRFPWFLIYLDFIFFSLWELYFIMYKLDECDLIIYRYQRLSLPAEPDFARLYSSRVTTVSSSIRLWTQLSFLSSTFRFTRLQIASVPKSARCPHFGSQSAGERAPGGTLLHGRGHSEATPWSSSSCLAQHELDLGQPAKNASPGGLDVLTSLKNTKEHDF